MHRVEQEVTALDHYLRRSGWILALLLGVVVAGLGMLGVAWKRALDGETDHHLVAELAAAADLDATVLEGSTRLYVILGDPAIRARAVAASKAVHRHLDSLKLATVK